MAMNEALLRGKLSQVPFARVLSDIWNKRRTGILRFEDPVSPKAFSFEKGALVVNKKSFAGADFLKFLMTSGELDLLSLGRAEDYIHQKDVSSIRALLEIPLLAPARIWELLETFVRGEAYPLFDREEGDFVFEAGSAPIEPPYIQGLSVPDLIFEGVRRMTNFSLIAAHLPPEEESIRKLSPHILYLEKLVPHEIYLLEILDSVNTLSELIKRSDLSEKETRRILFAFLCLGLAGARAPKAKNNKTPGELSLADLDRLYAVFNEKCSFVHKYISKEIGPVATSVIRKSLEEIKGHLDPAFQSLQLTPEGRIEIKAFLKMNMNAVSEENRRSLLQSMDEILAAEALAVKRTLGPSHESALIRGLERIGGLS